LTVSAIDVMGDATRGSAWAAVRLRVEGEHIVHADADGLERALEGLTLIEAATVRGEPLVVEALASALGQVFVAAPKPGRVAVAMSGGVDSAVALLRAAPDAIGVTLRLWQDPAGPSAERACCSPEAVASARATCHSLGIPHVTLDLREEFRNTVVHPFVDAYEDGLTPNPCTTCNGAFRFDALVAFAERAGADCLWTGHYARIVERDGRRLVARGIDRAKDQSYMLATIPPALLERVAFPLGAQTKEQTRAQAARAGLAVAARKESQEACFLAGDDYRSFLERQGVRPRSGAIRHVDGTALGHHDGYWRYTTGQRRGLGVGTGRALYVLGTDRTTNTVVVGPREALEITTVEAKGVLHTPVTEARVKLRYRSDAAPARVDQTPDGFVLTLERPVAAVARGQVAVLYDDDVVVGAGVIHGVS
jgi:tRNA-specific 2-thiouridylase